MIDVSLVLNLNADSKYLPRTLLSLKEASEYARAGGFTTELICVLDRADNRMRAALKEFDLDMFFDHKVIEKEGGSLGRARNAGIANSSGRYVRLCDGGDLISYNLVLQSILEVERLGPCAILMPEFVFGFGEKYFGLKSGGVDVVTPMSLVTSYPFSPQIFFHRDLASEIQYRETESNSLLAEDWRFAAEAISLGYKFDIAPETVQFARQRAGALPTQGGQLPACMAPGARLFVPQIYRDVCAESYAQAPVERACLKSPDPNDYLKTPAGRHTIWAANAIEPAIDLQLLERGERIYAVTGSDMEAGRRYYEICQEILHQTFDDIFILPFFGKGGAEKYFYNIIMEMCESKKDSNILLILGSLIQITSISAIFLRM